MSVAGGETTLINHPLDLIERHGVVPAVVESRRARGLVSGQLQASRCSANRGDTGRPETMAGNFRRFRAAIAALDHCVDILLRKGRAAHELAVLECREEGAVDSAPGGRGKP